MPNQFTTSQIFTDTHKKCSRCKELKLFSEFYKDKGNTRCHGLSYYCKDCCLSKARQYTKDKRHDPHHQRVKKNNYIKNRFSITIEEYESRLKSQDYKCAICKIELPKSGNFTHLDHCHLTGKIRSFLCTNCNRGLGHFKDSKEFLMAAIQYIDAHTDDGNQKEGTGL